jgi:hypothetical protein
MFERSKFQMIEVTDIRARKRSWKIFERGKAGKEQPLLAGIATRELAEAKLRELEAADEAEMARKQEAHR